MASIIHLNLSISSSVWKILYLTTPETPTEELGMTKHLKSWVRHERRHLIGLSPESQGDHVFTLFFTLNKVLWFYICSTSELQRIETHVW